MALLKGIKFIFIFGLFCVLGFFIFNNPGSASFEWMGYSVKVPIGLFIASLFLVLVLASVFLNVLKFFCSLPQTYLSVLKKKKTQKSKSLLIDGLSAIAAGQNQEAKEIMKLTSEVIPTDDDLTQFVAAQASYMIGDEENATRMYLNLLKNKRTSFLGLRGLLMQAKERNDYNLTQEYINKSIAIRPDSPWLQSEYLINSIRLAQKGIFSENEKNKLLKYIPKDLWHKHKAMIYWLKLQSNLPISYSDREDLHLKIFSFAPEWILNVKKLAELYIKMSSFSKAQKIIMDSFKKTPHRILGELWDIVFSDLQPMDRYRTMEKLVSGNEMHAESQYSLAQSAIKAQLWGQAEKHLDQFLSYGVTKTGCLLMAELMEKKYPTQPELSREWLQRAAQINSDYNWQCNNCSSTYGDWHLICSNCNEIDKIFWQQNFQSKLLSKEESITLNKLSHVV